MFAIFKCFGSYSTFARTLFPMCCILLGLSLVYIATLKKLPTGPDLCKVWKEHVLNSELGRRDEDKQWWEWACHLEMEWDKAPDYACRDQRYMANYQVCLDEPYKPSPNCLVYSFGVNEDFRFDDKMAELGCHVYSFDPSMNVKSYNRSERVHFIDIGLGTSNTDSFSPKIDGYTLNTNKRWQIRTLPAIMKMLGHENRVLDVLKMDIESYEWKVIKQLLEDKSLTRVKQLLLEWHIFANEPMRTDFPVMYSTYMELKKAGWRQFYAREESRSHSRLYFNSQMDNGLVNTVFAHL